MTSKNIFSYLGKRCLRIFPGLAICLIVVVAACSLFYTGDGSYWGQKETYTFIWRNLTLYPIQWDIPGVFENNFMATVNGSLWTLAPQFTLYILILALFFLRKHRPIVVALSFIALIICLTKNIFFADKFAHTDICYIGVNSFARFAQFFVVGMLLHERKWFRTDKARLIITGISATLAVALIHIHTYIHTYGAAGYAMRIRNFYHGWRNVLETGKRYVQACWRFVVWSLYLQFPNTADDHCKYTGYSAKDDYGIDYCNCVAGGVCVVENY
jgi:peptidoglycan/LPS O-acetylase OafA/YrhL